MIATGAGRSLLALKLPTERLHPKAVAPVAYLLAGCTKEEDKMKAYVHRDVCVGSALCVQIAPEAFELDDEGKSHVVDATAADLDTLKEAARNCPVQAIVVEEED